MIILSGIVSYGVGCGEAGFPGAYTRTSCYIQWIAEQYGMTGTSTSASDSSSWSTPCPTPTGSANNIIEATSASSVINVNNDINSGDYDVVESSNSRLFENYDGGEDDGIVISSRQLPEERQPPKLVQPESKPQPRAPQLPLTNLHSWPFYYYYQIHPTHVVQASSQSYVKPVMQQFHPFYYL